MVTLTCFVHMWVQQSPWSFKDLAQEILPDFHVSYVKYCGSFFPQMIIIFKVFIF